MIYLPSITFQRIAIHSILDNMCLPMDGNEIECYCQSNQDTLVNMGFTIQVQIER